MIRNLRRSRFVIYLLILAFILMTNSEGMLLRASSEKDSTESKPVVKVRRAGPRVSSEQSSRFNELMEEGKRLLKEWMDYKAAIQKFNEAKALAQTNPEKSDAYYYLSLAYFASFEEREKEFKDTLRLLIEVDYYRLPDENECPPQYIRLYDDIKREYGLLKILTNPPGADVYLNNSRTSAGKTPVSVGYRAGDVNIRVKKGGKQKKDSLTVVAGQSTTSPVYALTGGSKLIYYVLGGAALVAGGGAALLLSGGGNGNGVVEEQGGSLEVNSSPSGAAIAIGRVGASISDSGHVTPYTFNQQTPGDYEIRLTRENYTTYSETVTVSQGQKTTVNASMTYNTVKVTKPTQGDQIKLTSSVRLQIEWEVDPSSTAQSLVRAKIRNPITNDPRRGRTVRTPGTTRGRTARLGNSLGKRAASQALQRLEAGRPAVQARRPGSALQRINTAVPLNRYEGILGIAGKAETASLSKVNVYLLRGAQFNTRIELAKEVDAASGKYTWRSQDHPNVELKAGQHKIEVQSSSDSNVSGQSDVFVIFEADIVYERKAVIKLAAFNLADPYGIAVYKNNIYLTTTGYETSSQAFTGKQRLIKLDATGQTKLIDKDLGNANPWQIAAYNNHLYVAEAGKYRVARYDLNLNYTGDQWEAEPGKAKLAPRGVAVDNSGNVYINDYLKKVLKYKPNKTFVKSMHTVSEKGKALNLAVDMKNDILYIAERGIDTVSSYLTSGATNANWEIFPTGSDPVGIDVDSKGNVFVCTQVEGEQKVYIIGKNGNLKGTFGIPGKGPGQFKHPIAVAIDEADNVYVLDNHPDVMDIEKWSLKK